MLTREDLPKLPERPFQPRKTATQALLTPSAAVDAYFSLLALPASLWLGWIRNAHHAARRL
jgi:hypothetical protein